MKKLISLLCVVMTALMIPLSAVHAADNRASKLDLLTQLGICKDMSLVEFKEYNTVTKKSFYISIYNIMTDEEETDEKIISYLKRYNINIDEFTLRDNITREEALSATVSMLGYTYKSLRGDELHKVATQLGVRGYVKGELSENITLGEVVDLLSGAIEADMIMFEFKGSGAGYSYKIVNDVTPLAHYKDIHYVKGTVNKNSYASIIDDTPAYKGYVQIDNEAMLVGSSNAGSYIGLPVKAYVQYDSDDEGTIVYIAPNENNVTVTKVNSENIVDVDSAITYIEYEESETYSRTEKLQISRTVKVIFNGENYSEYTKKDLMPGIGYVELIDINRDETIDIINVESYKTVLVNYVSQYSMTVVNKYSNPATVKLDSDNREVTIKKDGESVDITAIKPNDILLVAESKAADGNVRVLISDKQENVFVTSMTAENELYAGEKIYKLSGDYIVETKDEMSEFKLPGVGNNYVLYLDDFGNIAYAVSSDDKIYIYAKKVFQDDSGDEYYMKGFTTEGTWEKYKLSKKIKVISGGMTSQGDSQAYKTLGEENFVPQLLRVEFNSDGELQLVETAVDVETSDENVFTRYAMERDRIYQPNGRTFGCDIYLENEAKVFIVPTDKNRETDYAISTASYFSLDKWYKVEAYDIDDFYSTDVAVYQTDAKVVRKSDRYYVTKKYKAVVDEDVRDVINCIYKGKNVELVAADGWELSNVNVGDVIVLTTNMKGEIAYSEVYKKVADDITREYPSLTDPTKIHGGIAFAAGYVEKIDGEKGMFTVDCGNSLPARFKQDSAVKYYLYDGNNRTEKVTLISLADVEPEDAIYIFLSYSKLEEVYVMRNVE